MKIALASDHRGFPAKTKITELLTQEGHEVVDVGCNDTNSCDYPDFAIEASKLVAGGSADQAMLFCGTGIGMSITANKIKGVRAALCHDELTAQLARKHNDANVLCLSGDLVGFALMERIVDTWLTTSFEAGRHKRRVDKINEYDRVHHD